MHEADRGVKAHLVGGGADVAAFARAAADLQRGNPTSHADLACFSSWGEVQEYVAQDAQGDELKLLVDLVDRFGAGAILRALDKMPREDDADLVISTAHRSKGRQFPTVRLAGDFPTDPEKTSEDERRLLYVAVTRARVELDATAVPWVCEAADDEADADADACTSVPDEVAA
jgi:ATP-dependent exoDNAse (exonuclease V) beta subunit